MTTPGRHADGLGLYLHVDPSGAKRWVFVFQWRGKRKEMGLGRSDLVSLAEAREARDIARKQVFGGVNPIEARRKASEAPAFKGFAEGVIDGLTLRSEKHRDQWRKTILEYAEPLHGLRVDEIDTSDVMAALKPYWTKVPETARRMRGRIERVLDAAKAKGYRSGENPARWRGHLALLMTHEARLVKGHYLALPWEQAPAFMADLRAKRGAGARALEFTILTVARSGMTYGAPWAEVDLAKKVWTIPGPRMKSGIEHRVPLTDAALEVLEGRPTRTGYLFSANAEKPLSNMTMDKALRDMGVKATVHGFRSTFRDWAGEHTEFPRELAEIALAHKIGDETERAYRRGDALARRRKLMEAWAGFLGGAPAGNPVDKSGEDVRPDEGPAVDAEGG